MMNQDWRWPLSRKRAQNTATLAIPQLFLWALVFLWIAQSNPYIQLITRLIIGIIIIYWLLQSIWGSEKIQLPHAALSIAVLVFYLCLSATRTPVPWLGIRELRTALVFILIMVFFINELKSDHRIEIWENASLSLGAFLSIFNVVYVVSRYLDWVQLNNLYNLELDFNFRLPGLFLNHPNVEAGFIALLIPIIIGRLILTNSKALRVFLVFIGLLFLTNLYFSSSRGAWVAILAGMTLFLSLTAIANFRQREIDIASMLRSHRRSFVYLAVFFVLAIIVAVAIVFNQLFQATGRPSLWPSRSRPWLIGWELITQSPVFGHGIGSTQVLIAKHQSIPTMPYLVHTHNLFLQSGVELGIIGIVLIAWLLYSIARTTYTRFSFAPYHDRIRLAVFAGCFLVVLTHHMVDFLLVAPIYVGLVTFLTGSLYSISNKSKAPNTLSVRQSKAFAIIGCLIIFSWLVPAGSFDYSNALDAFQDDRSVVTATNLCDVSKNHSNRPFFAHSCGRAMAHHAFSFKDDGTLEKGIAAYRRALELDPYWPIHWANLAAMEWYAERPEEALGHMRTALESAPEFALFNFNYAWMLEQRGDEHLAKEYYKRAAVLEPAILTSSKLDVNAQLLDYLLASNPFMVESPANYHARMGWYFNYLDKFTKARSKFLEAIEINPAHPLARAGLAYLDLSEGELESAEIHIQVALAAGTSDGLMDYIAGKIAFERGDRTQGAYHFDRAIDDLINKSYSDRYYNVVYQEAYLRPDTVPFLQSVFITDQMHADFAAFAVEIEAGYPEKAMEIREHLRYWLIE